MVDVVHLVCLEKGCRFLADPLPDRLCPNCGVEMVNEDRFLSRMRPKPVEEASDLPPEAREAARNPANDFGDFVLINVLGQGGAGTVYRAWQKKLRRYVAVKFLNSPTPESLRRFECEAQLAAQLRHPNIAAVHEVGEKEGKPFLVMDYIDGFPMGSANLSVPSVAEAFVKVCRAMDFAHAHSIIHRDLKPANILYENNGEPSITDFGLAKVLLGEIESLESKGVQGTPAYMSPEQARGRHDEVDHRSDVYSLGATLYCLVTGAPPFEGENAAVILHRVGFQDPVLPRRLNPEVPSPLEAIIMKALEKSKSLRYSTAEEMAQDLERFLSGEPVLARIRGPMDRLRRWARKNPWPVISGIAFLIAVGGVFAFQFSPPPDPAPSPKSSPVLDKGEEWRTRFETVVSMLGLDEFEKSSPEMIAEARRILSEIPEKNIPEVRAWFEMESGRLPEQVWPSKLWLSHQAEAKRILQWCSTLLAVLRGLGPSFEPVRLSCRDSRARFSPVAEYRGKISLRVLVWPYAQLKSLRIGDRWVVRGGKIVGERVSVLGGSLYTPLEMQGIDIGDYTFVFFHPEIGDQTVSFPVKSLESGKTYFCSGSLSDPASFSLRILP